MIRTKTGTVRRHGRGGYNMGCRCDVCSDGMRDYSREYNRLAAELAGVEHDVPVDRAQAHIRSLQAAGMGYGEIAAHCGVRKETIQKIAVGDRARGVRASTERAVLSVPLDPYLIDALPYVRRLQALAALGWSTRELHAHGINYRAVAAIRGGKQPTVTRAIATAIRDVYENLCMTPGPSDITRARAHAAGWHPPLAWDDIDNPAERPGPVAPVPDTPDPVALARALRGEPAQVPGYERLAMIRALAAQGRSDSQMATALGVTARTVHRLRSEHDIPPGVAPSRADQRERWETAA